MMDLHALLTGLKLKVIAKAVNLHPNSVTSILKGKGIDKDYTMDTIVRVEQEVLSQIIKRGRLAEKMAKEKGYDHLTLSNISVLAS